MNEDRCRKRFLGLMGKLNNKAYHVTNFSGNDNYDFITVMHPYVDGLEPKLMGWIYNTISMPVDRESFSIDEGYVLLDNKKYPVVLEIVNFQIRELNRFIKTNIVYQ